MQTTITIDMTERNFSHMKLLGGWIEKNKKSARERLVKYESMKTVDELDESKRKKLAASAEAALVQWGVYSSLINKITGQAPREPELFDECEKEEKGQEEADSTAQQEDGPVQPDGGSGTHNVATNRVEDGQGEDRNDQEAGGQEDQGWPPSQISP